MQKVFLLYGDHSNELTDIEEWAYRFVLERINDGIELLNKQNNSKM